MQGVESRRWTCTDERKDNRKRSGSSVWHGCLVNRARHAAGGVNIYEEDWPSMYHSGKRHPREQSIVPNHLPFHHKMFLQKPECELLLGLCFLVILWNPLFIVENILFFGSPFVIDFPAVPDHVLVSLDWSMIT